MKFYCYDSKNLSLKKESVLNNIKRNYLFYIIFSTLISLLSIFLFKLLFIPSISLKEVPSLKSKYEKVCIAEVQNNFTEEKFINKIKQLNLNYPHIVYAQAMLESGNFTSKIFKENNNMFGMKQARVRINLAKSTQYNHAYFETWEDCLLDFAFHRATYFSKLKTEQDYYNYLGKYYAEDPSYVSKLKSMVNKHKLKDKFK
jgi:flagellum-specific peptidoglycan hydrolase FlgJ